VRACLAIAFAEAGRTRGVRNAHDRPGRPRNALVGLLALVLVASAIPARSVARLDPLVALRHE